MKEEFCIIITTTGNKVEAEFIAEKLVKKNLAKCVQLSEVTSLYEWEGKLEKSQEFKLEVKALAANYFLVEREIKESHSYKLPEIIKIKIDDGSKEYLNWLNG